MYYTELPMKKKEKKTSKKKKKLDTKQAKKFPRRQAIQMSASEAEHLLEEIAPDWFKDTAKQLKREPVVVMHLQGRTPDQKIRVVVQPPPEEASWSSSSADLEQPAKTLKVPSKMLSPNLKTSSHSRKVGGHYRKQAKEEAVEAPTHSSTVIRMQVSGNVGKPYAYGSGLPEEQHSYLTVTSQTDL